MAAFASNNGTPQWYFYLQNDPLGYLPDGWHPYDSGMNQTVEQLYQTQYLTASTSKRARRLLQASSGYYSYEIDFGAMTQCNKSSGKERPIARTTNGLAPLPPSSHHQALPAGLGGGNGVLAAAFGLATAPATSLFATPAVETRDSSAVAPNPPVVHATKHGNTLYYTAPEALHQVRVDEAQAFVEVPPPQGKSVPRTRSTSSDSEEEKKQGDSRNLESQHSEECAICLETLFTPSGERVVSLNGCNHKFHYTCIHESLSKVGAKCPLCFQSIQQNHTGVSKTALGQCPSGSMQISTISRSCAGFGRAQTIQILYSISSGTQKSYHQNPDMHFSGATRTAYLPSTTEGLDLLARIQYAFCHGLCFMVGTSLTTGQPNTVTWASIHHKTSMSGGTFGFPDATYFDRSNGELDSKGVPSAAECQEWLAKL